MVAWALVVGMVARAVGLGIQKHGLPVLLCLESRVIICFVALALGPDVRFAAVLLAIGATERAVGLGCVVGVVRASGHTLVGV